MANKSVKQQDRQPRTKYPDTGPALLSNVQQATLPAGITLAHDVTPQRHLHRAQHLPQRPRFVKLY